MPPAPGRSRLIGFPTVASYGANFWRACLLARAVPSVDRGRARHRADAHATGHGPAEGHRFGGRVIFGLSFVFWHIIKLVLGVRVSPEEEMEGLDIGGHGNEACPDFQAATHK